MKKAARPVRRSGLLSLDSDVLHDHDASTILPMRAPGPSAFDSERRLEALGHLNSRIHMLVFTAVRGGIRVISFRKANKREVKQYEEATKP